MAKEQVEAQYQPQKKNEETNEMENVGDKVKVFGSYDFGGDFDEMVSIFGAETVYHHAKSSLRVGFQQGLRAWAGQGFNQKKMEEAAEKWEPPSGRPRGKTKIEKATELLKNMSEEERDMLLATLQTDG